MPQRPTANRNQPPRFRTLPFSLLLALLFFESVPLLPQECNVMSTWRLCRDLNRDGAADTLQGTADFSGRIVPRTLAWGTGEIMPISLPDWCTGGTTISPIDSTSILMTLVGKSLATGADTIASFILDQRLNSSAGQLRIGHAECSLHSLAVGHELFDPAVRDISGRVGFLLGPFAGQTRFVDSGTTSRVTMKLYPNPSTGIVTVELDGLHDAYLVLDVHRIDGSLALKRTLLLTNDRASFEVDCSLLPVGRYQARVMRDGVALADSPLTIVR